MWPQIFDSAISDDLAAQAPNLTTAINGVHDSTNSISRKATLNSKGGKEFDHYAKNGVWGTDGSTNGDLYEDLLAPGIGDGLMAETWMNGRDPNKIPTYCKGKKCGPPDSKVTCKHSVQDIRHVQIASNRGWDETQDHSKWAVSLTKGVETTFIADMNRQFSQAKRGGGALCYRNKNIWTAFSSTIQDVDKC